jgi:hypothetical protein
MTKMLFYEHAAWIIAAVVSGGSIEVGAVVRSSYYYPSVSKKPTGKGKGGGK